AVRDTSRPQRQRIGECRVQSARLFCRVAPVISNQTHAMNPSRPDPLSSLTHTHTHAHTHKHTHTHTHAHTMTGFTAYHSVQIYYEPSSHPNPSSQNTSRQCRK